MIYKNPPAIDLEEARLFMEFGAGVVEWERSGFLGGDQVAGLDGIN